MSKFWDEERRHRDGVQLQINSEIERDEKNLILYAILNGKPGVELCDHAFWRALQGGLLNSGFAEA